MVPKYFYGTEHWNYFTNDEDLGPVILSLKQETINGRDQFRYLLEFTLSNCSVGPAMNMFCQKKPPMSEKICQNHSFLFCLHLESVGLLSYDFGESEKAYSKKIVVYLVFKPTF